MHLYLYCAAKNSYLCTNNSQPYSPFCSLLADNDRLLSQSLFQKKIIMKILFRLLCLLILMLCSVAPIWAQPCTINTAQLADIQPAAGSTICADQAITLPNIGFTPSVTQPNPGVVWGLYRAQPTGLVPAIDASFYSPSIAVDQNSNPIIGGGTAYLSGNGLFMPGELQITVCFVPFISPDITPPADLPTSCSGINTAVTYPCFTILNPELNPLVCGDCGGPVYNDECSGAYSIDLGNPPALDAITFANNCATSANEPNFTNCFDDLDPLTNTAWFTFVGDGGTYTLNTQNCAGSSEEQLNNTQLLLFSGNCGSLTYLACNETYNPATTNYAGLSIATQAGATYYISADGYNGQVGEFCLDLVQTVAPPNCEAALTSVSLANGGSYCANGSLTTGAITLTGAAGAGFGNIVVISTAGGDIAGFSTNTNPYNLSGLDAGNYQLCVLNYDLSIEALIIDALANGNYPSNSLCYVSECVPITILSPNDPACFECEASISSVSLANGTTYCVENIGLGSTTGVITLSGINNNPAYATTYVLRNTDGTVISNASGVGVEFDLFASGLGIGTYQVCGINYLATDEPTILSSIYEGELTPDGTCSEAFCTNFNIQSCFSCNASIESIVLPGGSQLCSNDDLQTVVILGGENGTEEYQNVGVLTNAAGNDIISYQNNFSDGQSLDLNGLAVGTYQICGVNYYFGDESAVLAALDANQLPSLASDICAQFACQTVTILPAGNPACSNCSSSIDDINVEGNVTELCGTTQTGNIPITGTPLTDDNTTTFIITDFSGSIVGYYGIGGGVDFASVGATVGCYAVTAMNYALIDQTEVANCSNIACLQSGIDSGEICAALSNTLLFCLYPPFFGVCCHAEIGDVVVAGNQTTLCTGMPTGSIGVSSAATGDYGAALLITAPDGSPSVAAIGSVLNLTQIGTYQVCALSYVQTDSVTVIDAYLNGLQIADICTAQSANCLQFTVLSPSSPSCLDPLQVVNIVETVAPDGFTYTVSFDIIGGTGVYVVDGTTISGSTYTSQAIACGSTYSFNVTDSANSATIIVDGVAPCALPCPSAGTFAGINGNLILCDGTASSLTLSGQNIFANTSLVYILYTNAANPLGSIVATNSTAPTFDRNSAVGLQANTVYYIAAVAGYTTAGGDIDFADECTNISNGVGVVFLQPITFLIDEDCDWQLTGDYTITVLPQGGYPAYNPDATYQLSGNFNESLSAGETATLIYPSSQTPNVYNVTATDATTCEGSVSNSFPLCLKTPVEWLSFRGEVKTAANYLYWSTATEYNSDYFAVERSTDGTNFVRVGKVNAAGNSTTPRDYTFADKQALGGLTYYRLMQYDYDGTTHPSKTITLNRNSRQLSFTSVFPVPAHDELTLSFETDNYQAAQISIYDLAGQLVDQQNMVTRKGINEYKLSVAHYTNGIYFVTIVTPDGRITTRFVKN